MIDFSLSVSTSRLSKVLQKNVFIDEEVEAWITLNTYNAVVGVNEQEGIQQDIIKMIKLVVLLH